MQRETANRNKRALFTGNSIAVINFFAWCQKVVS